MFKLSFLRKLALMGGRITRQRSGSGDNETLSVTADLDETKGARSVSLTRRIQSPPRGNRGRKNGG